MADPPCSSAEERPWFWSGENIKADSSSDTNILLWDTKESVPFKADKSTDEEMLASYGIVVWVLKSGTDSVRWSWAGFSCIVQDYRAPEWQGPGGGSKIYSKVAKMAEKNKQSTGVCVRRRESLVFPLQKQVNGWFRVLFGLGNKESSCCDFHLVFSKVTLYCRKQDWVAKAGTGRQLEDFEWSRCARGSWPRPVGEVSWVGGPRVSLHVEMTEVAARLNARQDGNRNQGQGT